ncbi:MAG: hypothetical protein D9V46_06590 [Deltaproteobacteria bacterium]|uniref:hypothetical protein n=1 Tax=Hydrosulfovibrio ferrireducens TaxID=2934181 RepID=UPI0012273797|nr:MAG: hypothetical protein D9V46_06590 [Deltaproteobacteria bacterium]
MNEELKDLVKLKLPIVQKDYESCFAGASRIYDRIKQLHTFEVTVVAGLIAIISKESTFCDRGLLAGIMFLLGCTVIETSLRANLILLGVESVALESKLHEQDLTQFLKNIVAWEFGNSRVARRTRMDLLRRVCWTIVKPGFWLWHVTLALCLVAVYHIT